MFPLLNARLLAIFMLLSLILLHGGCKSSDTPEEQVLIYSRQNESEKLDPIHVSTGETVIVTDNLFETLITYDKDSFEIIPSLATEWKTSEDELTWTFKLREGVKFHDGTEMDSEAVKLSFERLIDDDHPTQASNVKLYVEGFRSIDKLEAKNKYEVVFHLKYPDAVFEKNLCMFAASIVSPAALKKFGKEFGDHPVGTGPFEFVMVKQGERLEIKAFDDYWGGRPKIDRVIYVADREAETRRKHLERGEYHIADNLPPSIIDELAKHPKLKVQSQPGLNISYLCMNNDQPPLNNSKVRQAIWYAINKKQLVADIYSGHATPTPTIIPTTLEARNTDLVDRDYNVEKAKELIQEAGVELPLKLSLHVMSGPRPYMQRPRETGIAVKGYLAKVGIEVEIITLDLNPFLDELRAGKHDLALSGWTGDIADPDNFLYNLLDQDNIDGGFNYSRFRNDRYHELIVAGKKELDDSKRQEMYAEAQQIVFEEAPLVPLVHAEVRVVESKMVEGFILHPGPFTRFQWTYFDDTKAE